MLPRNISWLAGILWSCLKIICGKDPISQAIRVIQLEKKRIPGSHQLNMWAALQLGLRAALNAAACPEVCQESPRQYFAKPFPYLDFSSQVCGLNVYPLFSDTHIHSANQLTIAQLDLILQLKLGEIFQGKKNHCIYLKWFYSKVQSSLGQIFHRIWGWRARWGGTSLSSS